MTRSKRAGAGAGAGSGKKGGKDRSEERMMALLEDVAEPKEAEEGEAVDGLVNGPPNAFGDKFTITQKLRGTIEKISKSFLSIKPASSATSEGLLLAFASNVVGIPGDDLIRTLLNEGDSVYFNLLHVKDVDVILSVWRKDVKDPDIVKEQEKAAKYVERQVKQQQLGLDCSVDGPVIPVKEVTPAVDMSAFPVDSSLNKFLESLDL